MRQHHLSTILFPLTLTFILLLLLLLLVKLLGLLLLHLIESFLQVYLLHVEVDLLLGLVALRLQPLLPHLLVVGQLLSQVLPLELGQVLDRPDVVVEQVASLLSTDLGAVQGHGCQLGFLFLGEFNPTLQVLGLVVATCLASLPGYVVSYKSIKLISLAEY